MNRNGFTLTEVVIALGIVSFAMIPLIGLVVMSLQSVQQSRDDTLWVGIIQERVAELRAAPGDSATVHFHDSEGKRLNGANGAVFETRVAEVGFVEDGEGGVPLPHLADTKNWGGVEAFGGLLKTFVVTVSWPADAPAEARESASIMTLVPVNPDENGAN